MRHLATIHWAKEGSTPAVRDALEAPVSAAREANDPRAVGYGLSWLARVVLDLGDDSASLALEAKAGRILREVGDRDALSASLGMFGENALARGDYARARRLLKEALVTCREMGNVGAQTVALMGLGDVARAERDLPAPLRGSLRRCACATPTGRGRFRGR